MNRKKSFKFSRKKTITSTLAGAYIKENKSCYFILITAVAAAVILFFGIFSFTYGKVRADIVRKTSEAGGHASNYLDEGTKKNKKDIERLTYVENVGCQKRLGYLMNGRREVAACSVLDKTAYEKIVKPAYTDIKGRYPQNKNEIMLSVKTLDDLGVKNPEIGMNISVDFQRFGMDMEAQGEQDFILSGYYKEYTDETSRMSESYVSKEYLKSHNISFYPLRLLINTDLDYLSGEKIEELLYKDVTLKNPKQMFFSTDSPEYQAVETVLGGYGTAACLGTVILFSILALVYNVLLVSAGQRIAQLSLLKIIGCTSKQIGKIILRQCLWIGTIGSFIGGILGSLIVYLILPYYIGKMYFGSNGNFENLDLFNVWLLLGAVIFTVITLLIASILLINRINRMGSLNTLRISADEFYTDMKRSNKFCSKDISLVKLAWRNAIRSPRQFVVSILLLAIACETALCAVMFVKGADISNQLASNPDFTIAITKEAIGNYPVSNDTLIEKEKAVVETIYDYTIFTDSMLDEIAEIAQLDVSEIEQTQGYFVRISDVDRAAFYEKTKEEQLEIREQSAFYPIANSDNSIWDGTFAGYHGIGIIRSLDDREMQKLINYIKEKKLNVDLDSFLKGMGSCIVHDHILTKKDEQSIVKTLNKPLYLYPALAMYEQDNTFIEKGRLSNCGYLDSTRKGFPELSLPWQGQDVLYYLVTESTFDQLQNFPKQTFQVAFRVESEKEAMVKSALKRWVTEQNIVYYKDKGEGNDTDLFTIVCNSDLVAKEKNYIEATRAIMGLICTGLFLIGIMNFMNTITTSVLIRKKEFFLLKCIGMTSAQQKKVLILEFFYYSGIILALLLIPGITVLHSFGKLMKRQIAYFQYQYPFWALVLITLMLTIICMCIPHIIFRKVSEGKCEEEDL